MGRAVRDRALGPQTESVLEKKAGQRRAAGQCKQSEGPGTAAGLCRASELFGMAAGGRRQSVRETAVDWYRWVVFAW